MKICQVICSTGHGGLERHCVDLSNALAQRHQVTVLAPPGYDGRLAAAVDYRPLPLDRWRHNPWMLYRLLRALRDCSPDIVHAQANKAAAVVRSVAAFVTMPRVATIHNLRRNVSMFAGYDRVIAVSRQVAAQIGAAPVTVIWNGIEFHSGPPAREPARLRQRFGIASQRPLALAVGRMVPAKGFDVLLRAWVGLEADLLLVGDGPQRVALQELARSLGLEGRVHFAGFCLDAAEMMRDVDLVVIASRNEGGPYTFIEALRARQVVVSTAVGMVPEVLAAEHVVPCDDVQALHDSLAHVLDHYEQAREAFRALWQRAAAEMTVASMVAQTERVYEALHERRDATT